MSIGRRLYTDLKATQPFLVDIVGRIVIGTTGAITTTYGKGFTIARVNTGLYTVTITATGGVPNILHIGATAIPPTAVNNKTMIVQNLNLTTGTFDLQHATISTTVNAADPASGATIMFRVCVQNASYSG